MLSAQVLFRNTCLFQHVLKKDSVLRESNKKTAPEGNFRGSHIIYRVGRSKGKNAY